MFLIYYILRNTQKTAECRLTGIPTPPYPFTDHLRSQCKLHAQEITQPSTECKLNVSQCKRFVLLYLSPTPLVTD